MSEYSADDCGGPDVCSGCSSWRHGVYEDGSGDPGALDLMRRATEIDLDGHVDAKGVRYIGKAARQPDGTWRCLADVAGCLCIVELRVRPSRAKVHSDGVVVADPSPPLRPRTREEPER